MHHTHLHGLIMHRGYAQTRGHALLLSMRIIFLFSWVCAVIAAQAQLRNAHWVMGGVWVTVQEDGTVQELPFSGTTSLHTACISDTEGQLALLADDQGIRNAALAVLPGGSAAELGWSTPMANYLVVPDPAAAARYWVFTVQGTVPAQAGWVQVDLSGNAGVGAVLGTGTTWFMQDCTAKLSATPDQAGTGYWVALHEAEGDAFHAYHLTASGLAQVPVISQAGSSYLADTAPHENVDRTRGLEFSAQGDRAAAIVHGVSLDTSGIDLLRFDPATGQFATHTRLTHRHYAYLPGFYVLAPIIEPQYSGLAFSATGEHLYATQFDPTTPTYDQMLVEFPVHLEDPAMIADSARGGTSPVYEDYMGPRGDQLAVGVDGDLHMLFNWPHAPKLNSFRLLPVQVPFSGSTVDMIVLSDMPLSFPNQCRNYHDSHPLGLGVHSSGAAVRFHVFPVPVQDRATVHWEGTGPPTLARWCDALGRPVREERLLGGTSPWVLSRGGLPGGWYVLELRNGERSLARRAVLVE